MFQEKSIYNFHDLSRKWVEFWCQQLVEVSPAWESFDGTTTKFHWMANAGLASHFANLLWAVVRWNIIRCSGHFLFRSPNLCEINRNWKISLMENGNFIRG